MFARSAQKMDDERKGSSVINVSTSSFVQAAVVANLPVRMCVSPSPLAVRLLDAGRGENEGREYMCRGDGTPARGEQRIRERTREREKTNRTIEENCECVCALPRNSKGYITSRNTDIYVDHSVMKERWMLCDGMSSMLRRSE